MLDGITVISKEMIETPNEMFLLLMFIGFGAFLFGVIFAFLCRKTKYKVTWGIISVLGLVFSIIILFGFSELILEDSGRYKYEVIIDDDVSFTELNKNYNVIGETNDNTWIIEDKANKVEEN